MRPPSRHLLHSPARRGRVKTACVVVLAVLALTGSASGATFAVDTTADAADTAPGDGVCATATDDCTLRAAVQEATVLAGDDEIEAPAGVYTLTLDGRDENAGAVGDLDVRCDPMIDCGTLTLSGDGATKTVIDGGGLDRVFDIDAPGVTLRDLTIQNGASGDENGSAIRTTGSLTLDHCEVRDSTGTGGAIHVCASFAMFCDADGFFGGPLTMSDTTVTDNTDLALISYEETHAERCLFADNDGGLFFGAQATIDIVDSRVTANGAEIIVGDSAQFTLLRSTVDHNPVALNAYHASVFITDSAIVANGSDGLQLDELFDGQIRDSVIAHNGACGIAATASEFPSRVAIVGTTIEDNGDCGFKVGTGFLFSRTSIDASYIRRNAGVGVTVFGTAEGGPGFPTTLTVTQSGIRDNGGGILLFGINGSPRATIRGSLVAKNNGDGDGGGIASIRDPNPPIVTIVNSTISGNTATGSGGGIYSEGILSLHNVTVADNHSGGSPSTGGGIVTVGGVTTMRNGILAGNFADATPSDCAGPFDSAGHNLIGITAGCALAGDPTGNLLNVDPDLGPLDDNGGPSDTHALPFESVAVDSGDPGGCRDETDTLLTVDQRGSTRPRGAACDMGAYESAFVKPTPVGTPTPVTSASPIQAPGCAATPLPACRTPAVANKSTLVIKDNEVDKRDSLVWQWLKGATTTKLEFGAPDVTTDYALCIYDAVPPRRLVLSADVPGGGLCGTRRPKACWKPTRSGFQYRDAAGATDGIRSIVLQEGLVPGKAKIVVSGKGPNLVMPSLSAIFPPLTVQLSNSDGLCWEATYSGRVEKEGARFKAKADPTPAPRPTRTPRPH